MKQTSRSSQSLCWKQFTHLRCLNEHIDSRARTEDSNVRGLHQISREILRRGSREALSVIQGPKSKAQLRDPEDQSRVGESAAAEHGTLSFYPFYKLSKLIDSLEKSFVWLDACPYLFKTRGLNPKNTRYTGLKYVRSRTSVIFSK